MTTLNSYRDSHPAWNQSSAEPEWLRGVRRDALARFESVGFPTMRTEAFKYSSTRKIGQVAFRHGDVVDVAEVIHAHRLGANAIEIVVVNGRIATLPSALPSGLVVRSLLDVEPDVLQARLASLRLSNDPFSALNQAFFLDGLWIEVAAGAEITPPVQVLTITGGSVGPTVGHPLALVSVGANARLTLVQRHVSLAGSSFDDAHTDCVIAAGARLVHHTWNTGVEGAFRVTRIAASVARDARYENLTLGLGGGWSRQDLQVDLDGSGAECQLDGLYLPTGNDHVDNHVTMNHNVAHTTSRATYKGVLADKAKAVFNGRVMIAAGAKSSDANLANRNVLLSADAEVDTKPELEIYNDDVKAAHGTTVGQLDEAQVFYLRTRGLSDTEARRMLTEAFAIELVDAIEDDELRAVARSSVANQLRSA